MLSFSNSVWILSAEDAQAKRTFFREKLGAPKISEARVLCPSLHGCYVTVDRLCELKECGLRDRRLSLFKLNGLADD